MPRPGLQEAIKSGLLSPNQLATMVGICAPTIRNLCESERLRFELKPSSRRELLVAGHHAIVDLKRHGFLPNGPPEALILTARFYIANREAQEKPVPEDEIPPECIIEPADADTILSTVNP